MEEAQNKLAWDLSLRSVRRCPAINVDEQIWRHDHILLLLKFDTNFVRYTILISDPEDPAKGNLLGIFRFQVQDTVENMKHEESHSSKARYQSRLPSI